MSTGDFQDFSFTIFWTPIAALQFMWLGTPVILLLSCILMGIFDVDKEKYQLDDGKYFVISSGIYVLLILSRYIIHAHSIYLDNKIRITFLR